MSNTSKGRAYKGSKLMMQIATSPLQKDLFDKKLGDHLSWLSPLQEDKYAEYQLNSEKSLFSLGLNTYDDDGKYIDIFKGFWPPRQPQWDGIAIGTITNTLYLFEAKSHKDELNNKCSASAESKELIKKTLTKIANKYGLKELPKSWLDSYYQLANRLAFLEKMKELANEENSIYDKVKLVLVNFVNDPTWDKNHQTSKKEWKDYYKTVLEELEIKDFPKDVIELYYNAPSIEQD